MRMQGGRPAERGQPNSARRFYRRPRKDTRPLGRRWRRSIWAKLEVKDSFGQTIAQIGRHPPSYNNLLGPFHETGLYTSPAGFSFWLISERR